MKLAKMMFYQPSSKPGVSPKLLAFSQLAQSAKVPHLDLSWFDLEWGPRKPWQQVVKEWREEQLEVADARRKTAVAMRKRHLEARRQQVREMRDRRILTTRTGTTTPSITPTSATATSTPPPVPPRTCLTLTTPQCIDQLSELISPASSRPQCTTRALLAEMDRRNRLMASPIIVARRTFTSPFEERMD